MSAAWYLAGAAIALAGLGWLVSRPRPRTLAEEEALLREYLRKVDAMGANYEPKPDGRRGRR